MDQSHKKALAHLSVAEANELMNKGEFGEGTMKPKIEAAIAFLSSRPKADVMITSIDALDDALAGHAGTIISV